MRKYLHLFLLYFVISITVVLPCYGSDHYKGRYCDGEGDLKFLRLIDESFAFFHPNPDVPNISMLYDSNWNTFVESGGWDAWWIQNSYGFSYSVTPFISDPWRAVLQNSWDMFWNNQGDGKRMGQPVVNGKPEKVSPLMALVAPDGSLGDASRPTEIIYKQGDGNIKVHDWFYEATAAGIVMQCEILLTSRDLKAIAYYLPKMIRACDFIEKTRDPKNNLFLVGPACNLLAPSYGGVKQADGTFGKGYLSGLSVTYLAALDRMVELFKLVANSEKVALYEHRQAITRQSLQQLLTPAGYFIKSLEPDGTKHGVLGQEKYGYLEGVVNADAVALRVVDEKVAQTIYKQIVAFPEIRPFDFLLTNAPGYDDTYWSWGNKEGKGMGGIHEFGCWVNGGVWGTVEGRAILMYYRLGKFDDIYRSGIRAMKWAKDFRMDDHLTQRGENSYNLWYDKGSNRHNNGVAITADNFAIPAATIRGLFDYEYKSDRLLLRPRIPGSITSFVQKEPVRFGNKKIYLSCRNGGPKVKSVTINGKTISNGSNGAISLLYNDLQNESKIDIVTEGGWGKDSFVDSYPEIPVLGTLKAQTIILPDSLQKPYAIVSNMVKGMEKEPMDDGDRAYVKTVLASFNAYQHRLSIDPGPGYFRPNDQPKKETIIKLYAKSAMTIYKGLENKMESYAKEGDPKQERIATRFYKIGKN